MVELGDELDRCHAPALNDRPWPSQELQALFNMVPDRHVIIEWIRGTGQFQLRRYGETRSFAYINMSDGFNYDVWAAALAKALGGRE